MDPKNNNENSFGGDSKQKDASLLYSESNLRDTKIRKTLEQKDYTISRDTKNFYEKEETQLRDFFSELKAPVKEDPTLVRKKRYEEKMGVYKEVMQSFDFKNLLKAFWKYEASTPEEIETLNDCRTYTKQRIFMFAAGGLALTSVTSWSFKRELSKHLKLAGVVFGLLGGGIYGVINSTEYVLKRFEGLGPDYNLGRLAIHEIDEYRMDKKLFKKV